MAIWVLDKHQKPLMPCSEKRARLLLERGRAVVHHMMPFTIRLKDRRVEDSAWQPVDHIQPRSKGGSERVSNLTVACHDCNQSKSNIPVEQFLAKRPERVRTIRAHATAPLGDAAAVNSTRWALFHGLKDTGLDVEVGSGGRTKWNRHQPQVPKAHCLDAACVGHVDAIENWHQPVLSINATGQGGYPRTPMAMDIRGPK